MGGQPAVTPLVLKNYITLQKIFSICGILFCLSDPPDSVAYWCDGSLWQNNTKLAVFAFTNF